MNFYDKFNPADYTIKEFEYWTVLLRQKQITLGAAVIILKREVASIGNVTELEMGEFPLVIEWYEEICQLLFSAEKFNYYAAMMKDNFVHFHAFPRYSKEVEKFGTIWKDEFWPKPVSLIDISTDDSSLKLLLNEMRM